MERRIKVDRWTHGWKHFEWVDRLNTQFQNPKLFLANWRTEERRKRELVVVVWWIVDGHCLDKDFWFARSWFNKKHTESNFRVTFLRTGRDTFTHNSIRTHKSRRRVQWSRTAISAKQSGDRRQTVSKQKPIEKPKNSHRWHPIGLIANKTRNSKALERDKEPRKDNHNLKSSDGETQVHVRWMLISLRTSILTMSNKHLIETKVQKAKTCKGLKGIRNLERDCTNRFPDHFCLSAHSTVQVCKSAKAPSEKRKPNWRSTGAGSVVAVRRLDGVCLDGVSRWCI